MDNKKRTVREERKQKPSTEREKEHHEDEVVGELTPKSVRKSKWRKRNRRRSRGPVEFADTLLVIEDVESPRQTPLIEPEENTPELDDEFFCLNARTALIIPFLYKTETTSAYHWFEELSQRKYPTSLGDIPLWQPTEISYKEVYDLKPHFRQVLGVREKTYTPERTWTAHRLSLNEIARQDLFLKVKLFLVQSGNEMGYDAEFESIELIMYPRGASLLVIHVNWVPTWKKEKANITLDEFRSLIYVGRYKKKMENVCNGWGLHYEQEELSEALLRRLKSNLGENLYEAKFHGKTLSLSELANWLICLPGESPDHPPHRIDTPRHALHHSTVVINKEPSEESLNEYLFHLRRAFGQKNRPPPNSAGVLGRVLVWRRNKYIGLSREGTVSLSWPISGNEETFTFEVNHWHKKFQGLYLILALHVLGEKVVFEELSELAAIQAENLTTDSTFEQMQRQRNRLRNLASVMTRYTVSMSSSDCGGTTEYSEFFISLREVFGVPELREELSGELKDVLAVVESNYLEEERRQRDAEEEQRRTRNEILQRIKKERSSHRQRFEIMLSIFGSITAPFVIVSGIWGMNLSNLPQIDFWMLILITSVASIFMLIFLTFMLLYRNLKMRLQRRRDTYEDLGEPVA